MKWLKTFADLWNRLSARERRLALIVGAVCAAAAVLLAGNRALERIAALDNDIRLLEDALVSSAQQIRVREAVEQAYREVAWQHSSAWTEAEIKDRLRNEVFRLAHNMPSPLNAEGIAEQVENESGLLVRRPELGEGTLEDREEGYREYRIRVRVDNVPFPRFVDYLERLQMSPQSLRIDGLRLVRNLLDEHVSAVIEISRIVVDRREEPWAELGHGVEAWTAMGCRIAAGPPVGAEGAASVVLEPGGPGGVAFLETEMDRGATYEMTFTARTEGDAVVRIHDVTAGANLAGEVPLRNDGQFHEYAIRFTLDRGGGNARIRLPFISLNDPDSRVTVAGVAVRKRSA